MADRCYIPWHKLTTSHQDQVLEEMRHEFRFRVGYRRQSRQPKNKNQVLIWMMSVVVMNTVLENTDSARHSLTLPSFLLSDSASFMAVKSTWLKSLKECPVYPCPGTALGKSLSPPHHRIFFLTSSHRWLKASVLASSLTRSLTASIRSTAVPG